MSVEVAALVTFPASLEYVTVSPRRSFLRPVASLSWFRVCGGDDAHFFSRFHYSGASLLTRRWVCVYRNLNKCSVPQPDQICLVELDSSGSG